MPEETFDWPVLANAAASAGNLLRAFTYAEQVFNSVGQAERSLKGIIEEVTKSQEELKGLRLQREELQQQIKSDKKSANITAQDALQKVNTSLSTKKEKVTQELLMYQKRIDTLKDETLNLEQTVAKKRLEYAKEISNLSNKLDIAKSEYESFLSKLKGV